MTSLQDIRVNLDPSEPAALRHLVAARFERSMSVAETFFEAEASRVSYACWLMAQRFQRGGRLISFGNGPCATDAQHVAVEFVHPVIVGKRALPALSLTSDSTLLSGLSMTHRDGVPFATLVSVLGRTDDIVMGFSSGRQDPNVLAALSIAEAKGMLVLGLSGGSAADPSCGALDYCFKVPSDDAMIVQEVHETLYHVLWELVHVFFEHEGLLE